MPDRPIYLDYHATTPLDARVFEAMTPYFTTAYGNAGSISHRYGWEAADALDQARDQVARLVGALEREIVFTSGATESNNLALKGILPGLARRGRHLVTTATEHKAVLAPLRRLSREGWELTIVSCDGYGQVSASAIEAVLTDQTVLVSVIAASNEVGTVNPVAEIGQLCRARGIVFHTDATQAVGKIPLNVRDMNIDLLSLSGHKMCGPKGIGALFVRRGGASPPRLTPLIEGGGQESGLRSGTVAVPLVVGLGRACEIARLERESESARLLTLRDSLYAGLVARLDGLILNGHPTARLPGNLNVSVEGVDGEALMMGLRDVAVSSGAACTSANPEPSHVLLALGRDEALARASLRFGLGRFTTRSDVDQAIASVAAVVTHLRATARAE